MSEYFVDSHGTLNQGSKNLWKLINLNTQNIHWNESQ